MSYGHVHRRNAASPEGPAPVVVEFERDFNLAYQSSHYEIPLVRHRRGLPHTAGTLTVRARLQGYNGSDALFGPSGGLATEFDPQPVQFEDGQAVAWLRIADLEYHQYEPVYPHFMNLSLDPGPGFQVGARGDGSIPVYVVALYPTW